MFTSIQFLNLKYQYENFKWALEKPNAIFCQIILIWWFSHFCTTKKSYTKNNKTGKVSNLINFCDLNYFEKILRFLNASATSSSSRFYSEPRLQRHLVVLRWSANTPICADVGLGRGSEEAAFNSESGHDHLWKCLFIIIRSRNLSSWVQKLLEGFSFLLNE